MTNKTAAIRYARALLDVALKEKANLEQIESELSQFVDLFKQYPPLAKVLLNPAVPVPRKRAAVGELLAQAKLSPIPSKLLALLADTPHVCDSCVHDILPMKTRHLGKPQTCLHHAQATRREA